MIKFAYRSLTPEKIQYLLKTAEVEEDRKMVTTYCAIHPDWSFYGPAEDGHLAFELHKEVSHGHT